MWMLSYGNHRHRTLDTDYRVNPFRTAILGGKNVLRFYIINSDLEFYNVWISLHILDRCLSLYRYLINFYQLFKGPISYWNQKVHKAIQRYSTIFLETTTELCSFIVSVWRHMSSPIFVTIVSDNSLLSDDNMPLPERTLTSWQSDSQEQPSVEFESKCKLFKWVKYVWKCHV